MDRGSGRLEKEPLRQALEFCVLLGLVWKCNTTPAFSKISLIHCAFSWLCVLSVLSPNGRSSQPTDSRSFANPACNASLLLWAQCTRAILLLSPSFCLPRSLLCIAQCHQVLFIKIHFQLVCQLFLKFCQICRHRHTNVNSNIGSRPFYR